MLLFLNNILIYEVFSGLLGIHFMAEMEEMYMTMIQPITTLSQKISLDFFLSMAPLVTLLTSVMEMHVILLLCQIT